MSNTNDITKVDPNFKVDAEIDKTGLCFYSPEEPPFKMYGVKRSGDRFYRLPPEVADNVSMGVSSLAYHTAGGRVRFRTNSARIAVKVRLVQPIVGYNFSLLGACGFDLYADDVYCGSFSPPSNMSSGSYESRMTLITGKTHTITINMPPYAGVYEFYIGLEDWAEVSEAPDYTYEKPIVYYGSSITQGGCVSRPGLSYQSWLSREFDANYINLGFAGSAKAEELIADYVASLDMSVFVYDYDHNSGNPEYLKKTHERMFRTVREAHPDIPILMMSAPFIVSPRISPTDQMVARRSLIEENYKKFKEAGDDNVYFIPGNELCQGVGNDFTCDNIHPNDLGFYLMARRISPVLREMLEKTQKV